MVIHNNNEHEHKHKREHNNTEEGEEVVPVEERTKKDDEQLKLNKWSRLYNDEDW